MRDDDIPNGPRPAGGGSATPEPPAALARTLAVLVVWFFVALWLGTSGALVSGRRPPIGLALTLALPLVAFALDARFGHPILPALARLPLSSLIAFQTARILGITFLIAWSTGLLPGGFALPAGVGDVTIGLLAPLVAQAVLDRRPGHLGLVRAFTFLGVADLVTAVTLGVGHSGTAIGFLGGALTTAALVRYPLSLIPTFFVPLALILHILAARAVRGRRA